MVYTPVKASFNIYIMRGKLIKSAPVDDACRKAVKVVQE